MKSSTYRFLFCLFVFLTTNGFASTNPAAMMHGRILPFKKYHVGTAWCLTDDCHWMVTNYHVAKTVGNGASVDGVRVRNTYLGTSETDTDAQSIPLLDGSGHQLKFAWINDVALLEMRGSLTRKGYRGVRLNTSELKPGDQFTVIGFPNGHKAIVGATFISEIQYGLLRFESSAPLAGGISGGIVLNQKDEAVGLVFGLAGKTTVVAVPMWSVTDFVKTVKPHLYASLVHGNVYRPAHGVRPVNGMIQNGGTEFEIIEQNPDYLIGEVNDGENPVNSLNESFLDEPFATFTHDERNEVNPEVIHLRTQAAVAAKRMNNFIAVQSLTFEDKAVWQHELRVQDGELTFRTGDGKTLTQLPIPNYGAVPGDEWSKVPSDLNNPKVRVRFVGDKTIDGNRFKVFAYQADATDAVCGFRTEHGLFHRLWVATINCSGEVWTDADYNLMRVTQELYLPDGMDYDHCQIVIIYGHLSTERGQQTVPTAIRLRARRTTGKVIASNGTYSNYRLFTTSSTIKF